MHVHRNNSKKFISFFFIYIVRADAYYYRLLGDLYVGLRKTCRVLWVGKSFSKLLWYSSSCETQIMFYSSCCHYHCSYVSIIWFYFLGGIPLCKICWHYGIGLNRIPKKLRYFSISSLEFIDNFDIYCRLKCAVFIKDIK